MEAAIKTENLTKIYTDLLGREKVLALDNLNLEVNQGEIFGLLGPNGSGKTTTIKLMLGLIFPTSGRVRIFGRSPQEPEARRRVGFLPESPYFYDYLTAREYLVHAAQLCELPQDQIEARAHELIEKVGLAQASDRPLRKFSKGMVQRLGLAQALINEPELIILDEPMSGLDPLGRRQVRELVLEQRAAGRTVLFSSHVLSDVEALCDRVVILDRGKAAGTGLLTDLLAGETPSVDLTIEGGGPALAAQLGALGCEVTEVGQMISARLSDRSRQGEVLAAVQACQARLLTLNPVRRSLEEIFLRRVAGSEG